MGVCLEYNNSRTKQNEKLQICTNYIDLICVQLKVQFPCFVSRVNSFLNGKETAIVSWHQIVLIFYLTQRCSFPTRGPGEP